MSKNQHKSISSGYRKVMTLLNTIFTHAFNWNRQKYYKKPLFQQTSQRNMDRPNLLDAVKEDSTLRKKSFTRITITTTGRGTELVGGLPALSIQCFGNPTVYASQSGFPN